jgi:ribosomal protein S18 acetylase RimI-like enzyme
MIRRATLADVPAVANVHVASSREAYAGLLPEARLSQHTVESRAALWTKVLGTAGSTSVHVAEAGPDIVGFGAVGRQRTASLAEGGYAAEVLCLYVLRQHHRQGLGRALMAAMAGEVADRHLEGVSLWVLRDNPSGRGFYERLGGTVIAEKSEGQPPITEVAYGWRGLDDLRGR